MKKLTKITKTTSIADISQHPALAEILITEFGFMCPSCPMAQFETLEQGALVHGLSPAELKDLVKRLNLALAKTVKKS